MLMRDQDLGVQGRREPFASCDRSTAGKSVESLLLALFAKEGLREGQLEAVLEVLAGRDCVVLLPTGAGKSLVYQLAGLCMPGRTLVVDPLVALIDDQVAGLRSYGMDRAAGISAKDNRLDEAADAHFVFVAPERLQRQNFRDELTERSQVLPINMAVVDEAHCVSEWGHDFRPAYLNFGNVLRSSCSGALGEPPLLALTGTASRAVLTDVLFQLGIANERENTLVRPASFDRPELAYRVARAAPENAEAALRGELRAMPGRFGAVGAAFFEPTGRSSDTYSGIVFVPTVNGHHGLGDTLQEVRLIARSAVGYSGGPPKGIRVKEWERRKTRNAEAFKNDEASVIVTTKAFGMGIDKPNIRWILHYGLPPSIEGYYQEVGRAGRDRRPAHCVLLLTEDNHERNRQRLSDDTAAGGTFGSRGFQRDDVDTALWFHRQAFPSRRREHDTLMEVFGILSAGDVRVPLGSGKVKAAGKRALHRLAVLGVIGDYHLEGGWSRETAVVRYLDPEPQDIVGGLLAFVERSQPGRLAGMRRSLGLPYDSVRSAAAECGSRLIEFVYDTVERSRRRSLREMWLLASDAAHDGEVVRQRVLEYLTEGDVAPLVLQLTEKPSFAFEDWAGSWSAISTVEDAREWRAATARLLGSYPDHPGLLASRGLAEALIPDGDAEEFERNLEQSLLQARDRYGASRADTAETVRWLLRVLGESAQSRPEEIAWAASADVSALRLLAEHGPVEPPGLAASVVNLAHRARVGRETAAEWLDANWHRSPHLAVLRLADTLDTAAALQDAVIERYAPGS